MGGSAGSAPKVIGATQDSGAMTQTTIGFDATFTAMVCDSAGLVSAYEKVDSTGALKSLGTGLAPGSVTLDRQAISIVSGLGVFYCFMVLDFSNDGLPANIETDLAWMIWSMDENGTQGPNPDWRGRS